MTREEVLNKIETEEKWLSDAGYNTYNADVAFNSIKQAVKSMVLEQKPTENFESTKDHILKLAGDYKCWDNRLTHDEALELCHMLEQEPCEDAVNRKEIQKKINRLWNSGGDKDYCMETLRDFVIEAPSVTPTRKKGKWERGYSFPDGEYVKCTVCGEIIKCIYPMHFCPNCGAEMESEE